MDLWLAVSEDGISVLDSASMQLQARHTYDSIVTFGGCNEDFMLVVVNEESGRAASRGSGSQGPVPGSTLRMLFQMKKPEVREWF